MSILCEFITHGTLYISVEVFPCPPFTLNHWKMLKPLSRETYRTASSIMAYRSRVSLIEVFTKVLHPCVFIYMLLYLTVPQLQVFDCVFYCWQDFCFFTRCLFNGDGTRPLGQFWGRLDMTIIYNSQRSTCHRSKIWIYSNTKHELVCYVCVYFFF